MDHFAIWVSYNTYFFLILHYHWFPYNENYQLGSSLILLVIKLTKPDHCKYKNFIDVGSYGRYVKHFFVQTFLKIHHETIDETRVNFGRWFRILYTFSNTFCPISHMHCQISHMCCEIDKMIMK